ncbi:hypothetical protein QN388_25560, partial [Pseudomonas sp. 5B4]
VQKFIDNVDMYMKLIGLEIQDQQIMPTLLKVVKLNAYQYITAHQQTKIHITQRRRKKTCKKHSSHKN